MRALDRKLLRDLWADEGAGAGHRRGDRAPGVAMFVMYLSNFDSLERTREVLLRRATASPTSSPTLKRAPPSGGRRGSPRCPASARGRARVVADVTLDVPGMAEPAIGPRSSRCPTAGGRR